MKARVRNSFVILLVFSAILLSACDPFFETNIFQKFGLGQVKADSLAAMDSSSLVAQAYSSDGQPAQTFFDTLATSESAKTEVLATLETTYTTSSDPVEVQNSAALYALVELKTTGADQIVSNLVTLIPSDGTLPSDITVDQVKELIPTSLIDLSSPTAEADLASLITAFENANNAYIALGTSVGSDASPSTVVSDVNFGTAAQSAVVAAIVSNIDPSAIIDPDTGSAYGSSDSGAVAAFLLDILNGKIAAADVGAAITIPDYSDGTALGNLLAAAGLSF